MSKIPIFIISFNRFSMLKQQIERLEQLKENNIIVVDNNSTYQPLLDYYDSLKYPIIRLSENYGHKVLSTIYKDSRYHDLLESYGMVVNDYAYTDPDVIPDENCPMMFLNYFRSILYSSASWIDKVGFGIRIDDIPDSCQLKEKVIHWESKYWKDDAPLHQVPIDTTLALRKKGTLPGWSANAIRTSAPYLVRHLPWYLDYNNLDEEQTYYFNSCSDSASWNPTKNKY